MNRDRIENMVEFLKALKTIAIPIYYIFEHINVR